MARVEVDGSELVVRLTAAERAESLHGDLRVARSSVRGAVTIDDPVNAVRGLKLVGSRLPGVFAIGRFRDEGRTWFVVAHHGTKQGVQVTLDGADVDEVVVGCDDPEAVVASLAEPS